MKGFLNACNCSSLYVQNLEKCWRIKLGWIGYQLPSFLPPMFCTLVPTMQEEQINISDM